MTTLFKVPVFRVGDSCLVRRMELVPQLVRRQQEELILEKVALSPEWLEEQRQAFLGDQSLAQVLETEVGLRVILIFIFSALRHCVVSQNNVLVLAWKTPFLLPVAAETK